MAMTVIWTGMTVGALVFSLALGNQAELAPAALDGASSAVQLGISMAGVLCLWMGVMEVMQRSGLAEKLARLLKPVLGRLFPDFASDKGTMDTLAANVSANLLGLGNAATPLGLETARRMSRRTPGVAGDSLCMLVVCNTASIQLIPTTVAAVRMAAGCEAPFDILPAAWAFWPRRGLRGSGRSEGPMLELVVPGILAGVACYGMAKGVDVYDALLVGAGKGLEILLKILPALVTLLTVVAMLRASGGLEVLADVLAPVLGWLGIPPETVGLMLVRPISGSAALGVGSELISTYGPDSTIGRTAAVMLGSTETTFYTIAVYFGATGIRKSRYAVPAALCADAAGFFFAALTVRLFMK